MATIACYKDYTLHIDPPVLPVPVCWWPFEVGAGVPWPDTAVPGLNLDLTAGSTANILVSAGKVGVQACRVDTSWPNYSDLTQLTSTGLLNMSLDGFTMTGWVSPNLITMGPIDYFGIRFRAYNGIQVDPFPPAFLDVYIQWNPNFGGTGTVELGLLTGGVQQIFELVTPVTLALGYHFFVLIYDRIAGKVRFSFDNAALTTSTPTYTVPIGWNTGAVVYQGNRSALGTLAVGWDEVNYFNGILDAGEISTIYNGGIGTTYP
jgi:hypothetical protein